MAHFAEIDDNNLVVRVLVTSNERPDQNADWLSNMLGGTWVQCSVNTFRGVHYDPETGLPSEDQGKALRKNFPSKGHTYDPDLDAFIRPKEFESWTLNKGTADWEPPTPMPKDGKDYIWDEKTTSWLEVTAESE